MRRPIARIAGGLLAVVLLALAGVACDSGGDDAVSTGTPPPSASAAPGTTAPTGTGTAPATTAPADDPAAARYRTAADAICTDQNTRVAAVPPAQVAARLGSYLRRVIPISVDGLRRLTALGPPPALAGGHAQMVGIVGRRLQVVRDLLGAIRGGADPEQALARAATRLSRLQTQLQTVTRRLGLTVCGQGLY